MNVHIVTYWMGKRKADGRPWPRFVRYLQEGLGWTASHKFDPGAHVNYFAVATTGWRKHAHPWAGRPGNLVCRFGQRPRYGLKARLWDEGMQAVDLRLTEANWFVHDFAEFGWSACVDFFPLEHDLFTIDPKPDIGPPVIGVAGYYAPRGAGCEMAKQLVGYPETREWKVKAAGRGWPIPCKRYKYRDLPKFYQSLDVYLVPRDGQNASTSVFQALACGVPVVIPTGVPVYDEELPSRCGVYRYAAGDFDEMVAQIGVCFDERHCIDRQALRELTKEHTVENFCAQHERVMEEYFG